MKTLIATPDIPNFNIRQVPIWAIEKIKAVMAIEGADVISFDVFGPTIGTPNAWGVLIVHIFNEGDYFTHIKKSHLNDSSIPPLYSLNGLEELESGETPF